MFDRPPRAVLLDAGETLLYAPHADAIIAEMVAGETDAGHTTTELRAAWNSIEPEAQARIEAGERPTLSKEQSQRFWFWFYGRLLTKLGVPPERHETVAAAFYERFTTLDTWDLYDDSPALPGAAAPGRRDDWCWCPTGRAGWSRCCTTGGFTTTSTCWPSPAKSAPRSPTRRSSIRH